MTRIALAPCLVLALLIIISWSPEASAQQTLKLNPIQALGQQVYNQHCGVCHTKPTILSPYYGPALSKEIVNNNEDALRDFINNGSDRMPGFRYTLEPRQIDAIIQYLKIVAPPADANAPVKPASPGNQREVD